MNRMLQKIKIKIKIRKNIQQMFCFDIIVAMWKGSFGELGGVGVHFQHIHSSYNFFLGFAQIHTCVLVEKNYFAFFFLVWSLFTVNISNEHRGVDIKL